MRKQILKIRLSGDVPGISRKMLFFTGKIEKNEESPCWTILILIAETQISNMYLFLSLPIIAKKKSCFQVFEYNPLFNSNTILIFLSSILIYAWKIKSGRENTKILKTKEQHHYHQEQLLTHIHIYSLIVALCVAVGAAISPGRDSPVKTRTHLLATKWWRPARTTSGRHRPAFVCSRLIYPKGCCTDWCLLPSLII